ncbi:hypothetical protein HA402_013341 [Bradysia odoriphaga]|nr:hypothetical protein HA402_013341 [Bradysia odoriphaga]
MNSIISNILKVKFVTIFCIFILLCMLSINTCQCRPERRHRHGHRHLHTTTTTTPETEEINPESESQIRKCFDDPTTMDLCQRCAKETKSRTVFPMCCSNKEGVKDWCEAYIYFGQ